MSKAFDSIQNTLNEDLKNVLNQDELHLIRIVLDVKIKAKHKSTLRRLCKCQWVYFAKSLKTTIANDTSSLGEHNNM